MMGTGKISIVEVLEEDPFVRNNLNVGESQGMIR
jgi:hypothetical protein